MPVVRYPIHPKARAHIAALLAGTAYRLVPSAGGDAESDPAVLLLTAYQPSARERRPCAGIRQLTQWRRDGERAPALICAFRSEARLLREPANALLRTLGTVFVRLPCRRDALLEALANAEPLSAPERENVVQHACTAWSQLARYADRLIAAECSGDVGPQVALLRAFARRRFGDWLDAPLAQAAACRARGDTDGTARHLLEATRRAPEAAIYRAFAKLAHGREADLSNKGLGPLRAMLRARQQGFVEGEALSELLASSSWARFKTTLQKTARTLSLLQAGSYSLPATLRGPVDTFAEQSGALRELTETGATRERPAAVVDVIDDLQEASHAILHQRADARRRMI